MCAINGIILADLLERCEIDLHHYGTLEIAVDGVIVPARAKGGKCVSSRNM